MADIHIRIYFREPDGTIADGQQEFVVASFAGIVPSIGDMIVNPGVLQGLSRHDPATRPSSLCSQRRTCIPSLQSTGHVVKLCDRPSKRFTFGRVLLTSNGSVACQGIDVRATPGELREFGIMESYDPTDRMGR